MADYTLADLPYDYSALEPNISGRIMELHHDKHHKAYVDGANTALAKLAEARDADDLTYVNKLQKDLAFNLAGHVNHTVFWNNLSPGRRRQAHRRARRRDRRVLRIVRQVPRALHRVGTGHPGFRLVDPGVGLARSEADHRAAVRPPGQPRRGHDPAAAARHVGARLLPRLRQREGGLRQGVLEHHQLGRCGRALHSRRAKRPRACCYCRSGRGVPGGRRPGHRRPLSSP